VTSSLVLSVAKKFLVDERLTVADLHPLPIENKAARTMPSNRGGSRAH